MRGKIGRNDRWPDTKTMSPLPTLLKWWKVMLTIDAKTGDRLQRLVQRPQPDQWGDDELLTLPEAAALFWPHGPLTTASLRTAHRDGQLAVAVIAGKYLTTKAAIVQMGACSLRTSVESKAAIVSDREAAKERAARMVDDFKRRARESDASARRARE